MTRRANSRATTPRQRHERREGIKVAYASGREENGNAESEDERHGEGGETAGRYCHWTRQLPRRTIRRHNGKEDRL